MDLHLNGKVVVITGGAGGIGGATGEEFLREGVRLAVCGRSEAKLRHYAEKMGSAGYSPVFYECADVADESEIKRFVEHVIKEFGKIDIWINNAGIAINKYFLDFTDEDWNNIQGINLKGVWTCCRAVAPYMMEQKSGVIINISSYASKIPHAEGSVYAASKAAVSSLTKSLAADLAPYNIRVVGIIPGMIQCDISKESIKENKAEYVQNIAMKRLGVPEDLAKPIVFVSSDAAGYMSGFDMEITGGKYAAQNTDWPWERLAL